MAADTDSLLTLGEVMERTALARPTIYRWARQGAFPAPCKCGASSRWSAREVSAWIAARLEARSVEAVAR